ncbi:MAG: MtaA/CmuA family methyltransferase [Clostridiales bacterium]|jgi:[methyl-Co(III) methanol-specific corrinoid protein]:coenzyme M methyltransferase|nr:MtaA/CmuA family methyltransferase [Clostridiales bacterium]
MALTPKERVLNLFAGKEVDRVACYSGMGNVTVAGLNELGYKFPKVHGDAKMMADLAATSYKMFGFECALVPFDLCVEAEVLGCEMNAYENVDQLLYPTIKEKAIHNQEEMATFVVPDNIANAGRVPVVSEAIRLLRKDIGDDVAIGTYLVAPFTLAGQLMDLNDLFKLSFKKPDLVNQMLDRLADVLIKIAAIYREAGVDYICVREMGATTDILSPRSFKAIIQPHLKKIHAALDFPNVLHICGSTNFVIPQMNDCGADAISIETKNDMVKTREDIGLEPLVFGNIDAYSVLCLQGVDDVEKAVISALELGVDAIWPGCDIWPEAKPENVKAMVDATKKYGAEKWARKK